MTTNKATTRAPAGLEASGRRLWRGVADKYELRPDELLVLEHAARTADLIDDLAAGLQGAPLMQPGSMGQARPNPLLAEIRNQRQLLGTLLRQLGLPDEDEGRAAGDRASVAARKAARARWTPPGGGRGVSPATSS